MTAVLSWWLSGLTTCPANVMLAKLKPRLAPGFVHLPVPVHLWTLVVSKLTCDTEVVLCYFFNVQPQIPNLPWQTYDYFFFSLPIVFVAQKKKEKKKRVQFSPTVIIKFRFLQLSGKQSLVFCFKNLIFCNFPQSAWTLIIVVCGYILSNAFTGICQQTSVTQPKSI